MNPLVATLSKTLSTLALLSLLAGAGCASAGKSTLSQPPTVNLGQFKSVTIEVKSLVSKSREPLDEFIAQLEARVIGKLRTQQVFEKIYPAAATDTPSELQITVLLTRVRGLNNFDRVMWGAMAGQASVDATLEIQERATGKIISTGHINGTSSGGSVMAGTTSEAVSRVADEVVRVVASYR